MPGSFSDFPALNLFTDRKVSGDRIGNGRIPERVIFYSDSMCAVGRLAKNHTLKPERRLNFRYVVIDAQEHRLDAETLDVIGSDPMASVDKTFLHPCGPFRNVGTRNHKAVIEYRETDFLPLIEFAHWAVGFHGTTGDLLRKSTFGLFRNCNIRGSSFPRGCSGSRRITQQVVTAGAQSKCVSGHPGAFGLCRVWVNVSY